jgi:hypothetical protein
VSTLSLFGSAGVQPVRRPAFAVSFGAGGGGAGSLAGAAAALGFGASGDPWARSVVRITVESVVAPDVGFADVVFSPSGGEPAVAVGDEGSIGFSYADAESATVFTGRVRTVAADGSGVVRLVATDAAGVLAARRVETSFENQSAGDVIRALAGDAAVSTGTIANGIDLPFLVVDGARSVWTHVAELARLCGHFAYVAGDGALHFVPVATGDPVQRFTRGEDILSIRRTAEAPAFGAVTTWGEGAAGSQGADAWAMLIKDPAPVTGTNGSGVERRFPARVLRSGDAVRSAASALAAAAQRLSDHGEMVVPGAPAVYAGATIEIAGAGAGLDGKALVTGVRHTYETRAGFRSRIRFIGAGSGASGLPGGL